MINWPMFNVIEMFKMNWLKLTYIDSHTKSYNIQHKNSIILQLVWTFLDEFSLRGLSYVFNVTWIVRICPDFVRIYTWVIIHIK